MSEPRDGERTGGWRPARQLVLDLARDPSYARDEFLVSACNEAAHAAVQRWPDWPDPVLLLIGPAGSGKSHLAAIWTEKSEARLLQAENVARPEPCETPAVLEDCDRLQIREADLFHFLNAMRETKMGLLLTARTPPVSWHLRTPDLLSRLRLAPIAMIDQPDADLIKAVIVKLFADRQIAIDEEVVSYAARHCEQSLDAANRFVAAVDEAALAAGRRITRPLAAGILAALADGET